MLKRKYIHDLHPNESFHVGMFEQAVIAKICHVKKLSQTYFKFPTISKGVALQNVYHMRNKSLLH